jgi:hypothetical protein
MYGSWSNDQFADFEIKIFQLRNLHKHQSSTKCSLLTLFLVN